MRLDIDKKYQLILDVEKEYYTFFAKFLLKRYKNKMKKKETINNDKKIQIHFEKMSLSKCEKIKRISNHYKCCETLITI